MPIELRLLLGMSLAWGFVAMATPVAIRVAGRLDFYDRPTGYKGHARPTPYLGGAAVMAGFVVALMIATRDWHRTLPLVIATAVLWAVGTLDDRRTVAPGLRVAVEAGLAAMLSLAGLGWHLGLGGAIELPLTVLWVVAVVNAFNLFDNMDGAASSMGFVVSTGVAVLGLAQGDPWVTATAAALAGACLGFLPHNLASPARIFLGDGGSMPLGFAVAALTMIGASQAVSAWPALIAGLLLVGVPLFDTFLVIVSRRRRGISVLTGGRDHLTHRARGRLRNARAVAVVLGGIQALFSALAVFASDNGSVLLVGGVLVYLAVAGVGLFLLDRRPASVDDTATKDVLAAPREEMGSGRFRASWLLVALGVILGLGAGLSPFFGGYYDPSVWLPIGLVLAVLVTAMALVAPSWLSAPALLTLGGLVGLAVWSLASTAWSDSVERALIEGNRMLVTAAVCATAVVLLVLTRRPGWVVAATGAGIGAVGLWVCAGLLGPHPDTLFLLGRLNQPLGYINAQGTVFAMGLWLCLAGAESRRPWIAGPAAGAASIMGSLALLSQSRGVAVAVVASGIAVLVLAPGRLRRCYGLLVVGAGILFASGDLLHVYRAGHGAAVPIDAAHKAGLAMLASAAGVALVWGLTVAAAAATKQAGAGLEASLRRAGIIALSVGTLSAVGVGMASAGRVHHTVSAQWHAFVHLSEPTGSGPAQASDQSRLVTGAGDRYDYWRIAWQAGQAHLLRGVGAGNYDVPYFKARRTTEDVRQPHSIELQAFSELGLVGVGFLAVFASGLAWGAWRMRASARVLESRRTLMVASVGATSAWLAHTSVDWIHLLPGVTGIALVLASALLIDAPGASVKADPRLRGLRPLTVAGGACLAAVLVLAAFSLTRAELAGVYADRAGSALASRPAQAIEEADRSLRLDAYSVGTYYTKAAGLAKFDQAQAASATLLVAARVEPLNFVTWALLGDLAVRRHLFRQAAEFYGRAHSLNPREPGLATVAQSPRSALALARP